MLLFMKKRTGNCYSIYYIWHIVISWSVFLEVRQEGWKWKIYLFVTYQIYTSMNMFNLRTGKLVQVSVHWSDHKNMTVKFLVVGTESWNLIVIIKLQVFGVNSISFFFKRKTKTSRTLFCFVFLMLCIIMVTVDLQRTVLAKLWTIWNL